MTKKKPAEQPGQDPAPARPAPAPTAGDPVQPVQPVQLAQPVQPVHPLPPVAVAAPVTLPELRPQNRPGAAHHLGLLRDVGVELSVVVGNRELTLEELLGITPGTVIDLERRAGDPVELQVNGRTIATAEIVAVDGRLGARIVEVVCDGPAARVTP